MFLLYCRTAAVYYADGSYAKVAQIEGDPAYKAFIREEDPPPSVLGFYNPLCELIRSVSQRITLGLCPKPPDGTMVVPLVRALRSAVEAHLGTEVRDVKIALPNHYRLDRDKAVENAVEAIGLRQDSFGTRSASRLAFTANNVALPKNNDNDNINMCASDIYPSHFVLVMDYSQYSVNAVLFGWDNGILDAVDRIYRLDVGVDNMVAILEPFVNQPLEPVFRDGFGEMLPGRIHELVLYGDALTDEVMDILREILGRELVDRAHVFEPVFGGAIEAAKISHMHMKCSERNREEL